MKKVLWSLAGFLMCGVAFRLERYPALLAQSFHETGNLNSDVFKNSRNGWGMKVPTKYDNGSYHGYATYATFLHSWWSRITWDDRHHVGSPTTVPAYYAALLANGYAEDPQYLGKVLEHYQALPKPLRWLGMTEGRAPWIVNVAMFSITLAAVLAGLWYGIKYLRNARR